MHHMPVKTKTRSKAELEGERLNLRGTPADITIIRALSGKLGLNTPGIIRLAIRRLAEQEGISSN